MALREFRDRNGVEWRAWDITPERMHPVTAREMFLGRYVDFQEGWIVFESDDERRRLAPYPIQWADFPVEQLEALLAMAQPSRRRPGETSGSFRRVEETRAVAEDDAAQPPTAAATTTPTGSATPASVGEWREFVGPSGRRWTVTLTSPAAMGGPDTGPGARRFLRFAADDGTVCDLVAWPEDWQRFTTAQFVELLRRAERAHDVSASPSSVPRRRREDRQP